MRNFVSDFRMFFIYGYLVDSRLEEARANEQAADFVRQEKILKLISTELTKNTTRVVETAVKGEVQSSVLPSLENITKTEVKSALNNQLGRGFGDSMRQVSNCHLIFTPLSYHIQSYVLSRFCHLKSRGCSISQIYPTRLPVN